MVYKNNTETIQSFIDVNGDPHEAKVGETIEYENEKEREIIILRINGETLNIVVDKEIK